MPKRGRQLHPLPLRGWKEKHSFGWRHCLSDKNSECVSISVGIKYALEASRGGEGGGRRSNGKDRTIMHGSWAGR
jgi:hypothetical protein